MAGFIFPQANQLTIIGAVKTPMATGLLKLFKSQITFTPALAQADLAAIECDFSGYAAITLTTLPAAFVDTINGGVAFQIPTQQWNTNSPLTISNPVWGGWIEDSTNVLLMAWQLQTPWQMDQPHKALPLDLLINMYGSNQVYVEIAGQPQ